jgi:hypothetical protein
MLQGRPEELQHLNDFLVGIGYKTIYENDFDNFMHKSDYNRVSWFYDSCRFSIEFTRQGKFVIRMDCVIKTKELAEVYDSPKGNFINYSKKNLEIPFEDANLTGIENNLMRNIKIIKEFQIEKKKQEIEKDFQ